MKPGYADLYGMPEDERIDLIGKMVIGQTAIVGVVVDDEHGKAERYVSKLTKKFPGIVIHKQMKGPTKGAVTIKVGPPGSKN